MMEGARVFEYSTRHGLAAITTLTVDAKPQTIQATTTELSFPDWRDFTGKY